MDTTEAEDLVRPLYRNGRYENPWSPWKAPAFTQLFKFMFLTKSEANIPNEQELNSKLPVIKPDLSQFKQPPDSGIRHMWIGHATSLVQFEGVTFLTDPVFSLRCSPSQWVGPKRYRPTPCSVEELPKVDCVVISHNHYDHLDLETVYSLNKRFGDSLRWYVPVGLKSWMNSCGCTNVVELSWWEEHTHESGVKFVSTPSQHWCKRTVWDDNKALWCSWCVIGSKNKFFFAGDTGYCNIYKTIGKKYGPFSLATIPIGAYNPRWILAYQHVDPKEAVDIHCDINCKTSIGIHWGTFPMGAKEFYLEPRDKVKEELKIRDMELSSFITVAHGEILTFNT
ncbi:N-acyl-phosphatidylethanolamine-hydrolyzing phospholipase D-like [Physella acuta]|uniref:N-acyl-phosphatidylethanolamine-hydrolyzing phospholipase D-like n=1 Tax=Physella acuta TaxID=109671 RepID=UPI0027DC2919|nr:N-acyl-phosphatidylethanolamine-hydrolyzing phospholipase D-like [Physella acuta]